jgi:hypothetical protein
MSAQIVELLDSDHLSSLRTALALLSGEVGSRYSVNLNVAVEIFDEKRPHPLPLLNIGLSTSGGKLPYKTFEDATRHKYVVDGDIQVVPHDHCPRCYGLWDYKLHTPSCPGCRATMGRDVKFLLDTDVCPFCEEGKVSMTNPICGKCGHRIDPEQVVWG